jgi:hypothetical protein
VLCYALLPKLSIVPDRASCGIIGIKPSSIGGDLRSRFAKPSVTKTHDIVQQTAVKKQTYSLSRLEEPTAYDHNNQTIAHRPMAHEAS